MNTDLLVKFEPMLTVALERFQRFKDPEPRDIAKIFGPVLTTIANVAGVDNARAASIIGSWDPAAITADTLRSAVEELTKPTMSEMTAARAKQSALELELARDAAAHPLTARDRVLLERKKLLGERSRDSILRELFEIRTGRIRLDSQENGGGWSGEELPGVVWDTIAGEGRGAKLQDELDARDCREHGVEYQPKASRESVPVLSGYIGPRLGV